MDRNLLKQRRQHLIRLQKDQDRQAALQNQAPATLEELAQGKAGQIVTVVVVGAIGLRGSI